MADDKTEPRFPQDENASEPFDGVDCASCAGRDSAAAAALHVQPAANGPVEMPTSESARSPRALRTQRIGVGVVAVLSAALIGVSAFALAQGGFANQKDVSEDVIAPVDSSFDEEFAASDDPASEEPGVDDAADGSSPESSSPTSDATAQSVAVETVQQAPAPTAQEPTSRPSAGAGEQQAEARVNVTVSIDSSAVGNPVSGSSSFLLPRGSTVYDALCRLTTPNGGPDYVRAIGGLAEFEHGAQSGWKYSVNGVDGTGSCGAYVLSDGDVVVWRYVTSLNG
ncbi:MAG: DUF4430 domain-containing protein [Slackia sp.]|nr:DUF4430 domain-containing protein [Slackia sp.]